MESPSEVFLQVIVNNNKTSLNMRRRDCNLSLMCTLRLQESTSTLEIFPGTSTLENEIQKYVQIRDFGLYRHFQVLEH